VTFTIEPTDTPADMATNFIAAAAALRNTPSLPLVLTTNGTAGEVLCTSRVAGAVGNEYDIRANPALGDVTVPGVTITVTQPTGGEGVPGIEGVLSAITTTWYTDIFTCFTDTAQTLADLQPVLIERNNPVNPVDSVAWIAWEGTQGQLATLVGEGVNSQFVVAMGVTNPPQPTWIWSASMAAVAAFALMNDPARQLQRLTQPGVIAPAPADQMQFEEQQALLAAGIATFDVAPDNSVTIQRAVTTYTENPLGVPDTSWQDVMSVKVMSRIRYDWAAYRKLIYPRNKLSDDNSVASQYDQTIATPKRLANSWAARCLVYEKAGWIEDAASLAQQAVFIRDANNRNQIDASIPINVLGNLMVMAQQLVFTAVD
jgi:phage tail sheath gpL-like